MGGKSAGAGPRSGRDPEQARHEGGLCPHVTPANVPNLSLSDHRHSLVAGQRSSRGWQTAKAQARPDQALDAPMVLLDDVVEVLIPTCMKADSFRSLSADGRGIGTMNGPQRRLVLYQPA